MKINLVYLSKWIAINNKNKKFRDAWQDITTRDIDLLDKYLKSISNKELKRKLNWYYSKECQKNAEGWLNKPPWLFDRFLNLFKNQKIYQENV